MKKILLIFVAFIGFHSMQAQEKNYIASDNIDTEGWRTIFSKAENIYSTFNTGAGGQLEALVSPSGDVTYFFRICFNEGKFTMVEGSLLLLKLGDGSTMELHSNHIGPSDYTYNVTKYGTVYYVWPIYEITEEQIHQIADFDVTKIRVQFDGGTVDRDIKKGKLSKLFSKAYPAIKSALTQTKSVYDNF